MEGEKGGGGPRPKKENQLRGKGGHRHPVSLEESSSSRGKKRLDARHDGKGEDVPEFGLWKPKREEQFWVHGEKGCRPF